jgi:ArsR family transcriptional regulator
MDVSTVCHALGNKVRYQIVKSLKNGTISTCCNRIEYFENGISVGDVVNLTGLAQSTVSQHLLVLEKAGVLRKEKREQWTCFFLNSEVIDAFLREMRNDLL